MSSGLDMAAALVVRFGPRGHRIRELVALLTECFWTFETIVGATGLSRRTVEELLKAVEDDAELVDGQFRIRPRRAAEYRRRFAVAAEAPVGETQQPDVFERAVPETVRDEIAQLVARAPRPRHTLDHVVATPDTMVRRAKWLAETYPAATRLLCVGDHDLTSLAACLANPALEAAVVDVDEELLAYIDRQAELYKLRVRTFYGDLRFGLPPDLAAWAHVVFTDPPYTPEGVSLFVRRGLEGLAGHEFGVVAIAYGFGEQLPTLGLKVQQAVSDLGLVYEAILPDFNRYDGAQAIGSRSDLYVCRPTGQTWKQVERRTHGGQANIYTRGPQSLEARGETLSHAAEGAAVASATNNGSVPLVALGGDWQGEPETPRLPVPALMGRGLPTDIARRGGSVAVNLTTDPGPWLLRTLLAVDAARLVLLVPNNHADLATQDRQQALTRLLAPKYQLKLRRSVPTSRLALVEATRVEASTLDAADGLRRHLLDRATSRLATAWRDGLIAVSRRSVDRALTKNQAREAVDRFAPQLEQRPSRIIDMPRAQISTLFTEATASIEAGIGSSARDSTV